MTEALLWLAIEKFTIDQRAHCGLPLASLQRSIHGPNYGGCARLGSVDAPLQTTCLSYVEKLQILSLGQFCLDRHG